MDVGPEGATQYVISARAFNNVGKGAVVYELVYTTDSASAGITASTVLFAILIALFMS